MSALCATCHARETAGARCGVCLRAAWAWGECLPAVAPPPPPVAASTPVIRSDARRLSIEDRLARAAAARTAARRAGDPYWQIDPWAMRSGRSTCDGEARLIEVAL